MKRLVLLFTMTIICLAGSAQSSLTEKVQREVERQKPKHSQPKKGHSETQAAIAAQQAAIATQANAAVANAQQQAQYIDQTYTAKGLAEQHSKKPTAPAGPHTATNYSQKNGQGIKFGKGAGKANEAIHTGNESTGKNNAKQQGQWGAIGGDGNSYEASYKNATQFKNNAQQKQSRTQRTPTVTTNKEIPKQEVSNSPASTQYPTSAKKTAPQETQQESDKKQTKNASANKTTSQVAPDNAEANAQPRNDTSHKSTPVEDIKKQMNCKNHIVRIEGPYDVFEMSKRFQKLNSKAIEDMGNHKVPQIPVPKKRVDGQYDIIISTNPTCLTK